MAIATPPKTNDTRKRHDKKRKELAKKTRRFVFSLCFVKRHDQKRIELANKLEKK